jgi:superfamily I DNA/RNA helicase
MGNETHIVGPPGTGKTSYLARQVERACEKYGADSVLACSFTRSAVAELNRRDLPIPKAQVGTLHALAYHALNMPKIVETGKYLKEFSEANPTYAIDDATRGDIDDGYAQGGKTEGAKLLQEYSRLRALMRPRDLWPARVSDFAREWEAYKQDIFGFDFTDLIETCIKEGIAPEFEAAVGMFDECQDFTPLELALVRQWGQEMETLVLVGDGDQCIYSFKGADSDIGRRPDTHVIVLKQSYRVSQAVHEFSERIINLIPPDDRLQREYLPTEEPGEVVNLNGTYQRPEMWFEQVQRHLGNYETVMILASCSYMVDPIIKFLRREAIPFSNSYRRRRRDWNPLVTSTKVVTAAARVKDYLAGWRRKPMTWTGGELNVWLPLTAGVCKRGGREKLSALGPDQEPPVDLLAEVLPLEAMKSPEWILDHLSAAHKRSEYQVRVGLKDWAAVEIEPALSVGTIHSVKGGEADAVILFPDMSPEAAKAVRYGDLGPTARMFFVGSTRARTHLYLGQPSNAAFALRWPG